MSKTVIIADDSKTARMFIKQCLEIAGLRDAQFLEANHGGEVLEHLESIVPSLIVTDINMPVKDGLTLVKDLKANPKTKLLPVIVITSAQNAQLEQQLKSLGVLAVIPKPISPPKLSGVLKDFT
jgi:two-component system chemotaxis response regulator CheY